MILYGAIVKIITKKLAYVDYLYYIMLNDADVLWSRTLAVINGRPRFTHN